jgi:hypothetical protein
LPAWGFYARNVTDLRFEDVRVTYAKEDLRPVLVCHGVEQLGLDGFKFSHAAEAPDPIVLNDVSDVNLRDTDISIVVPRMTGLRLVAEDSSGRFLAGKPYSVIVTTENANRQGLVQIEVAAAGKNLTRWVWLRAKQKKEVVLKGLTAPGAGTHHVRAGSLGRSLIVEEGQ